VILTGKSEAPYKSFLFQGLTQDAKGRKMSKSLGNVVEVNKLLVSHSADVSRFYMLRKCSPVDFMNFDLAELNRRSYQVLSTVYHLNRFFLQNAKYDHFTPQQHTLEWTEKECLLKAPDVWLLSKLQETIDEYTAKLKTCEFNFGLAMLEDFVIETLSRLYVPMIRKELWTDDRETLRRRQAIYAVLWHVLRTTTLLFNPITPFLSEALHQMVYKNLDPSLPESINLEHWPQPDKQLRNQTLENDFKVLFQCVSMVNSARQSAKLKRRWPLKKVIVIAPSNVCTALQNTQALFLELANLKKLECVQEISGLSSIEIYESVTEDNVKIFLDIHRDKALLGEGLIRDLARRIQSLRKEMGYVPTDILETVYIAGLDDQGIQLITPYLLKLQDLVRTKKVQLTTKKEQGEVQWHEFRVDNRKIHITIP
jgi:isoleucyl-tRNA synthetase